MEQNRTRPAILLRGSRLIPNQSKHNGDWAPQRPTSSTNDGSRHTSETPAKSEDGVCPSLVGWICDDGDAASCNADGTAENALQEADDNGFAERNRSTESATGEGGSKQGDKEHEAATVFICDGGLNIGQEKSAF